MTSSKTVFVQKVNGLNTQDKNYKNKAIQTGVFFGKWKIGMLQDGEKKVKRMQVSHDNQTARPSNQLYSLIFSLMKKVGEITFILTHWL